MLIVIFPTIEAVRRFTGLRMVADRSVSQLRGCWHGLTAFLRYPTLTLTLAVLAMVATTAADLRAGSDTSVVATVKIYVNPLLLSPGQASIERRRLNQSPGNGTGEINRIVLANQAPAIDSLSPARLVAGSEATVLTVAGRFFVNGAVVKVNGASRVTAFVNSSQLTAQLITSDLLNPGTLQVTVANPGGSDSSPFSLRVYDRVTTVSAASYAVGEQARDSILAAFGRGLATGVEASSTRPLPTVLRGTKLVVTDSAGVSRDQSLFFVSAGQVNFHLHAGTAAGPATLAVYLNNDLIGLGELNVGVLTPAIFTQNASGTGVPAAYGLRAIGSTSQRIDVFSYDAGLARWEAKPVDPGTATEPVYLVLFGTGFRSATDVAMVRARIGELSIPVQFIGATSDFIGLDQLNIGPLPTSLIGSGLLPLDISIQSRNTNRTHLKFIQPVALNGEWRAINGPFGGRISSMVQTGTATFATTYDRGIFRSTDNGESWTAVNNGIYAENIYTIASHNGLLFAGGYGIDVSNNSGQTWTRTSSAVSSKVIQSLHSQGSNLYAGVFDTARAEGTIYVTSDNGTNWSQLDLRVAQRPMLTIASTPGNLFAGTGGAGIFHSTNNGLSWTQVNNGLVSLNISRLAINGSSILAGTDSGLFSSTNNGASWSLISEGLTTSPVTSILVNGSDLYFGTFSGKAFHSTNNGLNWNVAGSGLPGYPINWLLGAENRIFAATLGGGIHRSTNKGASWSSSNLGLSAINFETLLANGDNLIVGTGGMGIHTSPTRGQSWIQQPPLTDSFFFSLARSGSNVYIGSSSAIYKSVDSGQTWNVGRAGLPSDIVTAIRVLPAGVLAGTYSSGIYLSTDEGQNWSSANNGLTNRNVTSLAVIGSTIFAATSGGGVFLSTNNGASWTAANSGLTSLAVTSLAVDGESLFAGTVSGVFVSRNYGESWRSFSTGLSNAYITSLATAGSGTIFASTTTEGVHLSYVDAPNWSRLRSGLPVETVEILVADGNRVFAIVKTLGIFTLDF